MDPEFNLPVCRIPLGKNSNYCFTAKEIAEIRRSYCGKHHREIYYICGLLQNPISKELEDLAVCSGIDVFNKNVDPIKYIRIRNIKEYTIIKKIKNRELN